MNPYRFYVPDLQQQRTINAGIVLPEDEAHHARNVLRLQPGATIALFDGKGSSCLAQLERVAKREVHARTIDMITTEEKPLIHLTLATAVPKGDRADQLIEQASQLNVSTLQWLDCDFSVVKPREGGGKMEKWRRQVVESAKQCGRAHLLEVLEPVSPQVCLRDIARTTSVPDSRVLWLNPAPGGASVPQALGSLRRGAVVAFIGPEGGWSETEKLLLEAQVAQNKIHRVRLTPTVLRIETAGAAVAALVMGGGV